MEIDTKDQQCVLSSYRASAEQVEDFVSGKASGILQRNMKKCLLSKEPPLWLYKDGATLVKEKLQGKQHESTRRKISNWLLALGTCKTDAPLQDLDDGKRTFFIHEKREFQPVLQAELVKREVDEKAVSALREHFSKIGNASEFQRDVLCTLLSIPESGFTLVSREQADGDEARVFCLIAVHRADAEKYQVWKTDKPFVWKDFCQKLERIKTTLRLTCVQADGKSPGKISKTADIVYFRPPVDVRTDSLYKQLVIKKQKERSQDARQKINQLKDAVDAFDGENQVPATVLHNGSLACTEEQKGIVNDLQKAFQPVKVRHDGEDEFSDVGGRPHLEFVPGDWDGAEIQFAGSAKEVVVKALAEMEKELDEKFRAFARVEGVSLDSAPDDLCRRVTWTICLKQKGNMFDVELYNWWMLSFNLFRNAAIKLFFRPRGPAWPEKRINYAVVPTEDGRERIVGPAYFDHKQQSWLYRPSSKKNGDDEGNDAQAFSALLHNLMNGRGAGWDDELDELDDAEDGYDTQDEDADLDDEGTDGGWVKAPKEWDNWWATYVDLNSKAKYWLNNSPGDECGLLKGKLIRLVNQVSYRFKGKNRASPSPPTEWTSVDELLRKEALNFVSSKKGKEMYGKEFVECFCSALLDMKPEKVLPSFILKTVVKFMERASRSIRAIRFRGRRAGNVSFLKAESLRRNGFTLELSALDLRSFMKLSGFDKNYCPSVRRPTNSHPGVRLNLQENQAATTVSICIYEERLWLHFPVMRPIVQPNARGTLPIVKEDTRDRKSSPYISLTPMDRLPVFLWSSTEVSNAVSFVSLDYNGASLPAAVAQFRVEQERLFAKLSDPLAQLHAGSKDMIEENAKLQSRVDHAHQLAMSLGSKKVKEDVEAKVKSLRKELETLEQNVGELGKLLVEVVPDELSAPPSLTKPAAKSRGQGGKKGPTGRNLSATRSGAARSSRASNKSGQNNNNTNNNNNNNKKKKGSKSARKEKTFMLNEDVSEVDRKAVASTLGLNEEDMCDVDFLSSVANEADWRRKGLQRQIKREETFILEQDALMKKLFVARYGVPRESTTLPDGLTEANVGKPSSVMDKELRRWAENWKEDALPGNAVSPWTPEMWAEMNKKREKVILKELNATRTRMERRKVKKRRRFSRRVKEERNQLAAKLGKENQFIFSGKPDIQDWIKRGSRILGKKSVRALTPLCVAKFHENLVCNVMLNYGVLVYGPWEGYTTNQDLMCHQYAKATVFTNRHRKCPIGDCPSHERNIRLHRELISVCNQVIAAWCQLNFLSQLRPGKDPP